MCMSDRASKVLLCYNSLSSSAEVGKQMTMSSPEAEDGNLDQESSKNNSPPDPSSPSPYFLLCNLSQRQGSINLEVRSCCCWLTALHPSSVPVYPRDIPAQANACSEFQRQKLQIKLTQSQHTDDRPTSPSAGPITPGAW